jgi:23S rRNA pseudouridine2605 synthase
MHPSAKVEREYRVRVSGRPGPDVLQRLLKGVELEDGPARFDHLSQEGSREGSHSSFRAVLHEGRNREVRRLWSAMGFEVSRLLRVRYGPISLPADLKPGQVRRGSAAEIASLMAAVSLKPSKYRAKDALTP